MTTITIDLLSICGVEDAWSRKIRLLGGQICTDIMRETTLITPSALLSTSNGGTQLREEHGDKRENEHVSMNHEKERRKRALEVRENKKTLARFTGKERKRKG